jgi:hypothetical protein
VTGDPELIALSEAKLDEPKDLISYLSNITGEIDWIRWILTTSVEKGRRSLRAKWENGGNRLKMAKMTSGYPPARDGLRVQVSHIVHCPRIASKKPMSQGTAMIRAITPIMMAATANPPPR